MKVEAIAVGFLWSFTPSLGFTSTTQSHLKTPHLKTPSNLFSSLSNDVSSSDTESCMTAREARIKAPIQTIIASFITATSANVATPLPSYAKQGTTAFDDSLKQYFPGSLPNNTILLRVQSTLRKRQYLPYNTLIATSLPSEEIMTTPISLVSILRSKLCEAKDGGVYNLGGIAGIPFAGDIGMSDLLSHSPKDGKIVILFGPNVGINKNGKVGQVERIGTEEFGDDEANGVTVRAYYDIVGAPKSSLLQGTSGMNLEYDYVVALLKKMPLKEWKDKGGDDYAIAKMTTNLYKIIQELVLEQVNGYVSKNGEKVWSRISEITLLGGITVNRGHGSGTEGGDDFFQPLYMETIVKGKPTSLFPEVFGDLPTPKI